MHPNEPLRDELLNAKKNVLQTLGPGIYLLTVLIHNSHQNMVFTP